jgi:hypothetical protein
MSDDDRTSHGATAAPKAGKGWSEQDRRTLIITIGPGVRKPGQRVTGLRGLLLSAIGPMSLGEYPVKCHSDSDSSTNGCSRPGDGADDYGCQATGEEDNPPAQRQPYRRVFVPPRVRVSWLGRYLGPCTRSPEHGMGGVLLEATTLFPGVGYSHGKGLSFL